MTGIELAGGAVAVLMRFVLESDAGTLECRGDEVGLGQRTEEGGAPVDHSVWDGADTKVIRELGELAGFDAERAHVG
jgi:hypothetical protein